MSRPFTAKVLLQLVPLAFAAATGVVAGTAAVRASQPTTATEAAQPKSLLGSYLAGRLARTHHDTTSAVAFYRRALERDPFDPQVVESSFMAEAAEGNFERATALARRVISGQPSHRLAHMWLATAAMTQRQYAVANEHLLKSAGGGPIGDLTATLARSWVRLAEGNSAGAIDLLRNFRIAEAAQNYVRYHRALVSDLSGRRIEAGREFEAVFRADPRTPRLALAYAHHLASGGNLQQARSVLKEHLDRVQGEAQPMVRALQQQVQGGQVIRLLIESPEQGYSEVFYGLGEALAGEGGVSLASIYLQMALMVRPQSAFALAALANVHELTKRYDAAIRTYDRIPKGTPLQQAVEIRKAVNLNLLEKVDEAKAVLDAIAARTPDDVRPLVTLGDIMRSHKRYAEAIEYYNRVIAMTPRPESKHWTYWYARGTSYERLKNWPAAEADLLRALQLSPDQPLVLNYLGYSWIDQNRNLKQGLAMIEKAVAAKPDDGYIVDSLGWAHYRLGNFKEAVRHLERAVELRPEDPVLNDHLGDAYWRVGREREARFQWDQALTLKPEPEEVEKIKHKLQHGLPRIAATPATTRKPKQAVKPEPPRKRVDRQQSPTISPFQ
jgi:tetratricopeptide (TPR) repeat protein